METRKISYDGKFELPLKAGNIIWRTDELAEGYKLYRMLKEKTEFADEVREALCILVGNLMLKDMEKGKELGEQMRPLMELCQKNAGITFKIKEG